jgi:hypothetical protein
MLITLARKPPPKGGTVVSNALQHGCGAINIDASRVAPLQRYFRTVNAVRRTEVPGDARSNASAGTYSVGTVFQSSNHPGGRWPPNVILCHGKTVTALDDQSLAGGMHNAGNRKVAKHTMGDIVYAGVWRPSDQNPDYYADSGGASRFFKKIGVPPC